MSKLTIGDKAIDFSLPGVDGETYSLANFSDSAAVAVIFSCNHCPYVLAWEDRLIDLQEEYGNQGVDFIAICANDPVKYQADNFDNMKKHAAEKGFNFLYVQDETQATATAYGAERTPEVFLFDSEGALRYHGAVDDNYDNPAAVSATYLADAIKAVLADEIPATAETAPVGCTIKWK